MHKPIYMNLHSESCNGTSEINCGSREFIFWLVCFCCWQITGLPHFITHSFSHFQKQQHSRDEIKHTCCADAEIDPSLEMKRVKLRGCWAKCVKTEVIHTSWLAGANTLIAFHDLWRYFSSLTWVSGDVSAHISQIWSRKTPVVSRNGIVLFTLLRGCGYVNKSVTHKAFFRMCAYWKAKEEPRCHQQHITVSIKAAFTQTFSLCEETQHFSLF